MSEKNPKSKTNLKIIFAVIIAVVTFAVYANTLSGDFVYDDKRQIVRNPLIQDSGLFGKALMSDVWAFKGDGTIAASNYWRPTFTAWSILNFQFFGLNPSGWHLLNILLHIGVCLLAFFLIRRWGLSDVSAFLISLIFAVHPVHTESVAWISGSPDLLFSISFLGSLWFTQNFAEKQNRFDLILALLFYALALGAKEIALICLPIYWLIFARFQTDAKNTENSVRLLLKILPFALLGIIYFFVRFAIIGTVSIPAVDAPNFGAALLTIPTVFLFYIGQIVFPDTFAANYSIRVIEEFSFFGVLLPLIISLVFSYPLWIIAKRSFVQKLGIALFILPLLPAMNLTAFVQDQLVHDRYLYLSLLGFLMLIVPFINELLERINKQNSEKFMIALVVTVCILFSYKTRNYNEVWKNDLTLWQHAAVVEPNSAYNFSQLGAAFQNNQRFEEAIGSYTKAIEIRPDSQAFMGRAKCLLAVKKYDEAIDDLEKVSEMPAESLNTYTLYQTYEALAIAYSQTNQLDKAGQTLIEARKRLPIYSAALTGKLAVVLYQKGEREMALRELESTKEKAKTEFLPESKAVIFRLGALYFEFGKYEQARGTLTEYLEITEKISDENTRTDRKLAGEILSKLP